MNNGNGGDNRNEKDAFFYPIAKVTWVVAEGGILEIKGDKYGRPSLPRRRSVPPI